MDTVLSPYVQIPLTEFCNSEFVDMNLDRGTWRVNANEVRKVCSKWLGIDSGDALDRLSSNYCKLLDVALCSAMRDMMDLAGGKQ